MNLKLRWKDIPDYVIAELDSEIIYTVEDCFHRRAGLDRFFTFPKLSVMAGPVSNDPLQSTLTCQKVGLRFHFHCNLHMDEFEILIEPADQNSFEVFIQTPPSILDHRVKEKIYGLHRRTAEAYHRYTNPRAGSGYSRTSSNGVSWRSGTAVGGAGGAGSSNSNQSPGTGGLTYKQWSNRQSGKSILMQQKLNLLRSRGITAFEMTAVDKYDGLKRSIKTGEIIGHRIWKVVRVSDEGFRLRSIAAEEFWGTHTPMEGDPLEYERGVHCFKDTSSPEYKHYAEIQGVEAWKRSKITALSCMTYLASGTVKIWGEVIEHEAGYRAQFAKVNSIDWACDALGEASLENLRRDYGCLNSPANNSLPSKRLKRGPERKAARKLGVFSALLERAKPRSSRK